MRGIVLSDLGAPQTVDVAVGVDRNGLVTRLRLNPVSWCPACLHVSPVSRCPTCLHVFLACLHFRLLPTAHAELRTRLITGFEVLHLTAVFGLEVDEVDPVFGGHGVDLGADGDADFAFVALHVHNGEVFLTDTLGLVGFELNHAFAATDGGDAAVHMLHNHVAAMFAIKKLCLHNFLFLCQAPLPALVTCHFRATMHLRRPLSSSTTHSARLCYPPLPSHPARYHSVTLDLFPLKPRKSKKIMYICIR